MRSLSSVWPVALFIECYLSPAVPQGEDVPLPRFDLCMPLNLHKMAIGFPPLTNTNRRTVYEQIDPRRSELSAAGKNVIITGGNRGIGAAIARAFAEAGAAAIGILARTEGDLELTRDRLQTEFPSTKFTSMCADIRDETTVRRQFSIFRLAYGPVDIMIHSQECCQIMSLFIVLISRPGGRHLK